MTVVFIILIAVEVCYAQIKSSSTTKPSATNPSSKIAAGRIQSEARSIDVKLGDQVNLRCQDNPYEEVEFAVWFYRRPGNNTWVASVTSYFVEENAFAGVRTIRAKDRGIGDIQYKCTFANTRGQHVRTYVIRVFNFPQAMRLVQDTPSSIPYQQTTFTCHVTNYFPSVSQNVIRAEWLKDQSPFHVADIMKRDSKESFDKSANYYDAIDKLTTILGEGDAGSVIECRYSYVGDNDKKGSYVYQHMSDYITIDFSGNQLHNGGPDFHSDNSRSGHHIAILVLVSTACLLVIAVALFTYVDACRFWERPSTLQSTNKRFMKWTKKTNTYTSIRNHWNRMWSGFNVRFRI